MQMDEIVTFIPNLPNKVITNRLNALNHCP